MAKLTLHPPPQSNNCMTFKCDHVTNFNVSENSSIVLVLSPKIEKLMTSNVDHLSNRYAPMFVCNSILVIGQKHCFGDMSLGPLPQD